MKPTTNFPAGVSRLMFVCLMFTAAAASPVQAGPTVDPFLEDFQVGRWQEPRDIALEGTYPAGLLAPVGLDTLWIRAALQVLESPADSPAAAGATRRILDGLGDDAGAQDWPLARRRQLHELLGGPQAPTGDTGPEAGPVATAVLGRRFFMRLADGDTTSALAAAGALLESAAGVDGSERERFVWDLRRRRVAEASGRPHEPPAGAFWTFLCELGPFDANGGWAMWVAHRHAARLPVLGGGHPPEEMAKFLAGLRDAWIGSAQLERAGFPAGVTAGLGAVLLSGQELQDHFARYPDPPQEFTTQGWWVKGRRGSVHGQAAAYEQLALRQDLLPAWRWDLWRRASELHLLAGRWSPGLKDLRLAVTLAERGGESPGLALRLRQWTEQALALALAQGDTLHAQEIRDLARRHFSPQDADAFAERTALWAAAATPAGGLSPGGAGALPPPGQDRLRTAATVVGSGWAPALATMQPAARAQMLLEAIGPPWRLWVKWGLNLTGADRPGADAAIADLPPGGYAADLQRLMKDLQTPGEIPDPGQILQAIGRRLQGRPQIRVLLDECLERDAVALADGTLVNRPSAVPALAKAFQGSQADLHALLGVALAVGDLRGILAATVLLPDTGLPADERLCFLYPLPAPGPVLNGILAATSDPALLLAVARNESLFEPAVRSRAGALGWMQIMPFHFPGGAAVPGRTHWSMPAVSIAKGDRLLEENRTRFGGDPYRVLAAYNAGPEAALRWERQLGGPCDRSLYLAWIGYPETRHYVEKVLVDREIYTAILAGQIPAQTDR